MRDRSVRANKLLASQILPELFGYRMANPLEIGPDLFGVARPWDDRHHGRVRQRKLERGRAKHEMKDTRGEIADYTLAIEYKPDYQQAYYQRGLVRCEIGDKWGGCDDLNKAMRMGSDLAYNYIIKHCNNQKALKN